jgi:hypothetical protein
MKYLDAHWPRHEWRVRLESFNTWQCARCKHFAIARFPGGRCGFPEIGSVGDHAITRIDYDALTCTVDGVDLPIEPFQ